MTFQEIFQAEGLYKSDSFAEGVAFKIARNQVDNQLELSVVSYSNANQIVPSERIQVVHAQLFNKQYKIVHTRQSLFIKK